MDDDERRRDGGEEDRDADPSVCSTAPGRGRADRERLEREPFDIEQLHYQVLIAWWNAIDCDNCRWQVASARLQARRRGDARELAKLDQAAARLRDASRRARRKLRHLRAKFRRFRSGGKPGRPTDPPPSTL